MSERLYPADFAFFFAKGKFDLTPNFIEKYQKGYSLAEIAKEYGRSENGVRSSLVRAGITCRRIIIFIAIIDIEKGLMDMDVEFDGKKTSF